MAGSRTKGRWVAMAFVVVCISATGAITVDVAAVGVAGVGDPDHCDIGDEAPETMDILLPSSLTPSVITDPNSSSASPVPVNGL